MKKLGLNPKGTDKIYSLGAGGYYRKTDAKELYKMFETHRKEMKEAIENDKTGEGFIYNMFCCELNNHEYSYTGEIEDTIEALNLTIDEINNNENLLHGLKKACIDCQ